MPNSNAISFPSRSEVAALISELGLEVGGWNEIKSSRINDNEYVVYRPDRIVDNLLSECEEVIDCLPDGKWILFQFDNSNVFLDDQISVINDLMNLNNLCFDSEVNKSILFTFIGSWKEFERGYMKILIFLSLAFEWNVYVVSAGGYENQYVGLQDGSVYFMGKFNRLPKLLACQ